MTSLTADLRAELRAAVDQARRAQIAKDTTAGRYRDLLVTSHGSTGYKRGCRCDVCRGYRRDSQRAYRERRRAGGR